MSVSYPKAAKIFSDEGKAMNVTSIVPQPKAKIIQRRPTGQEKIMMIDLVREHCHQLDGEIDARTGKPCWKFDDDWDDGIIADLVNSKGLSTSPKPLSKTHVYNIRSDLGMMPLTSDVRPEGVLKWQEMQTLCSEIRERLNRLDEMLLGKNAIHQR